MVAATVQAPRALVSRLTVYDHAQMRSLLAEVRKLKLDDAMECGALWVEYVQLDNGYEHFRLEIGGRLFGIVDVRGDLNKVQRALTAYLWQFGARAENTQWIENGARAPRQCETWRRIDGQWVKGIWKPRDLPKLFTLI